MGSKIIEIFNKIAYNVLSALYQPFWAAVLFDSRIKSDVFAKVASGVFAANGIKVEIYYTARILSVG